MTDTLISGGVVTQSLGNSNVLRAISQKYFLFWVNYGVGVGGKGCVCVCGGARAGKLSSAFVMIRQLIQRNNEN